MNTHRQLKSLLSESYQIEDELLQLLKDSFNKMFDDYSSYAFSLLEEDLQSGREYNGCLQGLEYYKERVEQSIKRAQEIEKLKGE